jgi:2-dehydropantoate 2-reductase
VRIGVVGAGGVGGLLAGLLARAGHEVALVARGRALEAIRERGLRVTSPLGTFTARLEVGRAPGELAPVDFALVAVKTWQVAEVAPALGAWLREGGLVVPLENGVDAADECTAALGAERVVGGFCRMLSWIAEPGAIEHVGEAPRVTLGPWRSPLGARVTPLVEALERAGVVARVAADFPAELWEKFLFIASFGGVGALTRATALELRTLPETRRLLSDAFEEIRAVALARGVALAPDVVEATLAYVDTLPEAATASMQRDVVAGRPSELASLSGAVVRIAAEVGVSVPVHRMLQAALLPQERAARARALSRGAA